jgi:hypothetical protein
MLISVETDARADRDDQLASLASMSRFGDIGPLG